jgi:lipopolysaccharide biosynthesis glycosyltransferase
MLHIAYASDAHYATPMAVSLLSCAAAHKNAEPITFWLIDDGVPPAFTSRLQSRLRQTNSRCALELLSPAAELHQLPFQDYGNHLTIATLLRLLLPRLLPSEVKTVLYIDGDTLVSRALSDLFAPQYAQSPVAAARDWRFPTFADRWPQEANDGHLPYFNAGVLLMNLDIWRSNSYDRRLINLLLRPPRDSQFQDQDAINILFSSRIAELPCTANLQTAVFTFKNPYRQHVLDNAKSFGFDPDAPAPRIIHFTGPKPWKRGGRDPYRSSWWSSLSRHRPIGPVARHQMKMMWFIELTRRAVAKVGG